MGVGINSARQARCDDKILFPQGLGQFKRKALAVGAGIAGADDRDGLFSQEMGMALADQKGRGVFEGAKRGRVNLVAQKYQEGIKFLDFIKNFFSLELGANLDGFP